MQVAKCGLVVANLGNFRSGMSILNAALPPAPSRTTAGPVRPDPRLGRWWVVVAYAGSAVYALAVLKLAGQPVQRIWGEWAAAAYALAALAAMLWRTHGRDLALVISLAGAFLIPLHQVTVGRGMSRIGEESLRVIERSAELLLRHGSPYLPELRLDHFLTYNPYEPLMAVFGLPAALGMEGAVGNPRFWMGAATALAMLLAFRLTRPRGALWLTVFAIGSPVLALELTAGQTDVPVLALLCLMLAFAQPGGNRRPVPLLSGLALGLACAMKATAWPAIPVMIALFAARDGARAASKFAAASVLSTLALMLAAAPSAVHDPVGLFQNTVLFPLGMTPYQTPAASLLPGHLLAAAGPFGHLAAVVALAALGLGIAISLVVRPPRNVPAASARLVLGLSLMFALAPASRWGYFFYPAGLIGFTLLVSPRSDGPLTGRILAAGRFLRDHIVRLIARLASARAFLRRRFAPPVGQNQLAPGDAVRS
jgi:Glycosyltransferase family 87